MKLGGLPNPPNLLVLPALKNELCAGGLTSGWIGELEVLNPLTSFLSSACVSFGGVFYSGFPKNGNGFESVLPI